MASSLQPIAESLLLDTGASRAMLQLASPDGGFPIAAEAVTHGARQIRNDPPDAGLLRPPAFATPVQDGEVIVQDDLELATAPVARALIDRYGARARMLAPVSRDGRLEGVIAVHHVQGPRHWETQDLEALRRARTAMQAALDARERRVLATTPEGLRDAALQAILDRLREGLRVQRCTLRQNVNAAYAFPVTHESRADGVWSLRGDFTIIQSGQPVIEKMLAERVQVVQNDTRSASTEPLFHVMLKHYGDMRAQIVTPMFREDSLAAVLSVHSLKELRTWTPEEIALARTAARYLGLLVGATLA